MNDTNNFLTCHLADIVANEPLPCKLYLYIEFRFITYRAEGDSIDRAVYDRLEKNKVNNIFIKRDDSKKFNSWSEAQLASKQSDFLSQEFQDARKNVRRKYMDVFHSAHPDKIVAQTVVVSKKLVLEMMKTPYVVKSLKQLQTFSQGTVEHSVNVSVLSIYLAMQMGYTHHVILGHVGMGGLLHDIGKMLVNSTDEDTRETLDKNLLQHPILGLAILEKQKNISDEVKMIVAQHHERHDGSGLWMALLAICWKDNGKQLLSWKQCKVSLIR
jgi:putative nucleotidyltransferase with HDIG domain